MTTSLSPTSSETPLASAATGAAAVNGLLDLLAGASAPFASGEIAATGGAAPTDFAQLLPTGSAAHATVVVPRPVHAGMPTTGLGAPQQTAPLASGVRSVVLRAPDVASGAIARDETAEVPGLGETAPIAPIAANAAGMPTRAGTSGTPTLPERATLEAALALLLPFAPVVAPVMPVQTASAESLPRAALAGAPSGPTPSEAASGATYRVTLAAPGRAPVEVVLPVTNDPLSATEIASALVAECGVPTEFSLPRRSVPSAGEAPAKVDSTIELPGGVRLTVEARVQSSTPAPVVGRAAPPLAAAVSSEPSSAPAAVAAAGASRPENSAASAAAITEAKFVPKVASEKNFLSAAKPAVTPSRDEAGIGVAQVLPAMPLSSPAPIATAHAAAPVAALVEKLPPVPVADVPVLMHTSASVAHRAVETVTQVVEAQTASRLQPVPSVQLRFKVGGEDLSVRVELREGEVRAEFRTDNAELRTALAQEWRAVTGRAESVVRFLEPVITPANGAGPGSNSFSSQQHSSSQHQQQAQQQFRAQAEMFGSVGRSFVPTVESAPAVSVVTPLMLPTSQRLSAVA